MYIRDIFSLAGSAIAMNKLRTVLTVLGISIGTAAVLIGITLGVGNREAVMQRMGNYGSNNLWFYTKVEERGIPQRPGELVFSPLTVGADDVAFIKKECPAISDVSPVLLAPALLKYSGG